MLGLISGIGQKMWVSDFLQEYDDIFGFCTFAAPGNAPPLFIPKLDFGTRSANPSDWGYARQSIIVHWNDRKLRTRGIILQIELTYVIQARPGNDWLSPSKVDYLIWSRNVGPNRPIGVCKMLSLLWFHADPIRGGGIHFC